MKRLLPAFSLIFVFGIFAYGQAAYVIAEMANLRGTPSASGKVVSTLARNSVVQVIKQQGPWFLVQSPDFVGWLQGNTLELSAECLSQTYATPSRKLLTVPAQPTTIVQPNRSDVVTLASTSAPATEAPATLAGKPNNSPADPPKSTTVTGICKDGSMTFSLEKQGACADHGGISSWMGPKTNPTTSAPASTPTNSGGPVQVKGYTRNDGTVVAPYTRSAPRRRP